MRRVLGWAGARAYDRVTVSKRSAAASAVVGLRIDHLCARLGSECRLGGTCRTCHQLNLAKRATHSDESRTCHHACHAAGLGFESLINV